MQSSIMQQNMSRRLPTLMTARSHGAARKMETFASMRANMGEYLETSTSHGYEWM
jgi:hypothetical protein